MRPDDGDERGAPVASPRARLLAIGDELTHGHLVDTNSPWLARELESVGIVVDGGATVGDDLALLTAAIRDACAAADVVVATGGLGPTEDDRTRHAAAAAAGVDLVHDEVSWQQILGWFAQHGRDVPESNRRQALVPVGAFAMPNAFGTAPGFRIRIGRGWFFAMPGVPREMRGMTETFVLPLLRDVLGATGVVHSHWVHLLGPREADAGERIADLMRMRGATRVGITAHNGLLTVRIAVVADVPEVARAEAERVAAEVRLRFADVIVHEGQQTLAAAVVDCLRERGLRLAVAESCTGGRLASALTDVGGSSDVFDAGFVTYANHAKSALLGVPTDTIERHGAVSAEVAAAMAEGAASRSGATFAVSITGVAGPSGGTDEKPVGTVWFATTFRGATRTWKRRFPDLGRAFVRERACLEALAAILRELRADPPR
jgi:nicotinamide-nucleotide amidase